MLRALVLVGLLGCAGTARGGPAWPKLSEPEVDGGESLAPRVRSPLAINDVADDDATDDKSSSDDVPTVAKSDDATTDDDDKSDTVTAPDDVINIDDIVIDIDDDD